VRDPIKDDNVNSAMALVTWLVIGLCLGIAIGIGLAQRFGP
jgi:hypothetical protein